MFDWYDLFPQNFYQLLVALHWTDFVVASIIVVMLYGIYCKEEN